MKILVDADGSRRIKAVEYIARKYNVPVILFCDCSRVITSEYSQVIQSDIAYNSTDRRIFNNCEKGDIVVTNDIGLAGIVLAKGAKVIHGCGRIVKNKEIDREMERRAVKQKMFRNTKHKAQCRKVRFDSIDPVQYNFHENLTKLILEKPAGSAPVAAVEENVDTCYDV